MKLNEIKTLDDGKVVLDNGYYLTPDEDIGAVTRTWDQTVKTWGIHRFMDDEEHGEAAYTIGSGAYSDEYLFQVRNLNGQKFSTRVDANDIGIARAKFFQWVNMIIKRETTNESSAFQRKSKNLERPVWLHRLNGDGSESRMNDAKSYFDTEDEAIRAHNYRVQANPGKAVSNNLHSKGELGTFTIALHGHSNL